jgi:hypothetical protein
MVDALAPATRAFGKAIAEGSGGRRPAALAGAAAAGEAAPSHAGAQGPRLLSRPAQLGLRIRGAASTAR